MKKRTMSDTEYLLRTVRESECMPGWQDSFSKMMQEISKEFSDKKFEVEIDSFEMKDV